MKVTPEGETGGKLALPEPVTASCFVGSMGTVHFPCAFT